MPFEHVVVAIVLAGALWSIHRALVGQLGLEELLQSLRASLTGAWVCFVVSCLVPADGGLVDETTARGMLAAAVVVFAVAVQARHPPKHALRRHAVARAGLIVAAGLALAVATTARTGCGVVIGSACAWCAAWTLRKRAYARLRFALHLFSMLGSVGVAAPLLVSQAHLPGQMGESLAFLQRHAWPWSSMSATTLAVLLLSGGAWLKGAAASSLMEAGGTPDPLDPPTELCTTGPYAVCRHPMLLAQCSLVLGACVAWGTFGALVWAFVFVGLAWLVVRPLEDHGLVTRHGKDAMAYQERVSALPWRKGTKARESHKLKAPEPE
jgi:protein-S-isoprenylcysteine O-methyltransferase Ste14